MRFHHNAETTPVQVESQRIGVSLCATRDTKWRKESGSRENLGPLGMPTYKGISER